ncbi:MAG: flavodoxin domain-containing protein [Clostridiaceae bacterium]
MKIVIIYDSVYGNAEKIGMAVKGGFGTGHEVSVIKAKDADCRDIEGTELLIVGSPTHGGWFTEPVKVFLDKLPEKSLEGIKAASFATSSSAENQGVFMKIITKVFCNASPRIAKVLKMKGADIIGSESFLVTGKEGPLKDNEIHHAQEWARNLLNAK